MEKVGKILTAIITLIVFCAATAKAQQVNVTVDGVPVQFVGTKPLMQQGRVLVPLRGVLEKMGAFVEWDAVTRTVSAQKDDRFVQLPIGSRTATVDGRQITLDVPAAVMAGSTMVPLRFLGEALGTAVMWDGPSRTVVISTAGEPPVVTPGQSSITSFTHDARGWLRAGSTIRVTLTGAPGGEASFEIPGVMTSVRATEVSSGRYTGSWTVPSNTRITVSDGAVIGMLRVGGRENLIQAGNSVSVDTVAPQISDRRPAPDSRVALPRPGISVVLDDGSGSGIDTSSVKMTVNGVDVTEQATVTPTLVAYKPARDLAGDVTATVTLRDEAGNASDATWKFAVRAASEVIKSFTHSDISDLQPGDVLQVKLQGEAGGTASFSIVQDGQTLRTRAMQETTSGNYEGEYTIRRDDQFEGATITGTLKTAQGEVFTTETQEEIGGSPSSTAPRPPVITQPTTGAAVASPLTVRGTAPVGSSVSLRITYVTTVLGMMQMRGTVSQQTVDVDAKGGFTTEPINLGTLVRGRDTEYTLTATTVSESGEESQPITVMFTGS